MTNTATGTNKYDELVSFSVGDVAYFKSDVEQAGTVERIEHRGGSTVLVLTSADGFSGDYIGGQTEAAVDLYDCWSA